MKKPDFKLLWRLFITFCKMGPATFGGGFAMIPLIEKEMVEKHKWVDRDEVADIFAIAQSIPGAIAINSATFIGYRLGGVMGAIVAMFGVMLPTFLIVLLLSFFMVHIEHNPKIEAAFTAMRATIVALITYGAIKIGKTAWVDKTSKVFIVISVVLMLLVPIHPVIFILCGGLIGWLAVTLKKRWGIPVKLETGEEDGYIYEDYFIGDGI